MSLPAAFGWTKIGTEAGETTDAIIARKALEARFGGGVFGWGVGNAPSRAGIAALLLREREPELLFSPMASAAKAHDVQPAGRLLWRAYRDPNTDAYCPLPEHMLITSRAPAAGGTPRHYALFAHVQGALVAHPHGTVSVAALTNLCSGSPVGASQVTAVVGRAEGGSGRVYPVMLRANWLYPHWVALLHPRVLQPEETGLLAEIVAGNDADAWRAAVTRLRRA